MPVDEGRLLAMELIKNVLDILTDMVWFSIGVALLVLIIVTIRNARAIGKAMTQKPPSKIDEVFIQANVPQGCAFRVGRDNEAKRLLTCGLARVPGSIYCSSHQSDLLDSEGGRGHREP